SSKDRSSTNRWLKKNIFPHRRQICSIELHGADPRITSLFLREFSKGDWQRLRFAILNLVPLIESSSDDQGTMNLNIQNLTAPRLREVTVKGVVIQYSHFGLANLEALRVACDGVAPSPSTLLN